MNHHIGQKRRQEYEETKCMPGINNNIDDRGPFASKNDIKLLSGHSKYRRLRASYPKPLFHENRCRLGSLLGELARAHKWKEASGALSVLLKGFPRGTSFSEERRNFLVAMEIHKRLEKGANYGTKINNMYKIWMSKLAWLKKCQRKKYLIYLESTLFSLSSGSIHDAYSRTNVLVKDYEIETEPLVNLIHGLILYQMWYSGLPDDMQIKDVHINTASNEGEGLIRSSDERNAINIEKVNCSESSVGNEKHMSENQKNVLKRRYTALDLTDEHGISPSETSEVKPSSILQRSQCSIFYAHGLEKNLLPIQLPELPENQRRQEYIICSYRRLANGNYSDSVKHLKLALHSKPPLVAALLPLIQILLLGDHVEEALMELEYACQQFDTALPFRLKARILECFHNSQEDIISVCYEDALKRDPTCNYSLERLIEMHRSGTYSSMLLFELITSHLDAVDGTSVVVWDEFALCFLKFASSLAFAYEDCISTNVQETSSSFINSSRVPVAFTKGHIRESWKLRCRWWITQHFGKNAFLNELQLGDYELLACKAACACHMYGRDMEYVRAACSSLENNEKNEQIILLQRHMSNALNLQEMLKNLS